jgi:hypothetical protein
LIETLRQNIIADPVFICACFAGFKRLYRAHFRQIHAFHQAVHSSAADAYAIITFETKRELSATEPLISPGIQINDTGPYMLISLFAA